MHISLKKSSVNNHNKLRICGSKSESNRLLILQALFPDLEIKNLSLSNDTQVMQRALTAKDDTIYIQHAGTAMRFLTAYFAVQEERKVILTGSERMQQRPIGELVEGLRMLGAKITYLDKNGFPPLEITGTHIAKNQVSLDAGISSQFISSLLLIAPSLKNGLEIKLKSKVTSEPYIYMTLSLLEAIGVECSFENDLIKVKPFRKENFKSNRIFIVEPDWSSASYFYSIVALSAEGTKMELLNFKNNSLQGDSALSEIYKNFGVETIFDGNSIVIEKKTTQTPESISLNLKNTPDIAQTIAVTCFGMNIECHLTGLHTLKIKETDRLQALKAELNKLGATIEIDESSFKLFSSFDNSMKNSTHKIIQIDTYNDHRMAMSFAPLALLMPLQINNAEVVEKSYPQFWEDLQKIGFELTEIS